MASLSNKFNLLRPEIRKQLQKESHTNEQKKNICKKTTVNAVNSNVSSVNSNVDSVNNNVSFVNSNVNAVSSNENNVKQVDHGEINYDEFGKQKLNTPWSLWFHNDPTDWKMSGYTKLTTFTTLEEYANIMSRLHNVESIRTINLYLFRENIQPIWEDPANANGGNWSIKEPIDSGYDLWRLIADKIVTETLLKQDQVVQHRANLDINGTINGISINNKQPLNTIVKICVSDRKVSNQLLIDPQVKQKVASKIMYQIISPDK